MRGAAGGGDFGLDESGSGRGGGVEHGGLHQLSFGAALFDACEPGAGLWSGAGGLPAAAGLSERRSEFEPALSAGPL